MSFRECLRGSIQIRVDDVSTNPCPLLPSAGLALRPERKRSAGIGGDSRVRGDARPDSDVDIAVVLDDFESPYAEIGRTSQLVADLSLESDLVLSAMPIREADWLTREKLFIRNAREEAATIA